MSTTTAPRVRSDRNTAGGAVITPGFTYWPGGAVRPGPGALSVPKVLTYSDQMAQHATVVYAGVTAPTGLHAEAERKYIRDAGWKAWHAGPWTHYTRTGRTVAVGYLDGTGDDQPLFSPTTEPAVIASRLDSFGRAIGYTWLGTCATTALGALRLSWENSPGNPLWKHPCPVANPGCGALIWQREPSRKEATVPAWSWDINGMYLAAAGSAEVAYSRLDHTGSLISFDPALPGYWLVTIPAAGPWAPPLVDADDQDQHGRAWVTTPTAELLQQRHGALDVWDSWTGRTVELGRGHGASSRVFRRWADTFKAARTLTAGTDLAPAVKRTYAAAVGGLRRDTMTVHRPDWSHTIIGLARANMLRRVYRVHQALGVWPVQVNTDEVTYRYPDPHLLEQHLGVSDQLGAFKRSGGAW